MNIEIRKVVVSDAKQIVDYCNQVAGESDNMSFGAGEFGIDYKQETKFLESIKGSKNNFMMIALKDEQIIGLVSIGGALRPRVQHNVDLGISVMKDYWNCGVASKLLNATILECKQTKVIRNIHLLVVADNINAIGLYHKFNFKQVGRYSGYHFIDEEYKDILIMEKIL